MTADLRKLLGAAKVAVAAHQAYPDGKSSLERARREMALHTAAVNALPALLNIVEAAQRHTAAVYRKATCDAAGAFDASVEFEDSYNALTAALAQWEKQNG